MYVIVNQMTIFALPIGITMKMQHKSLFFCALALCTLACNSSEPAVQEPENPAPAAEKEAPLIGFAVVKTYPHDQTYFTEGFEFNKGRLLESSGGNAQESPYPSAAGVVNLSTGKVDTKIELDAKTYFGEGITVFGNTLYQLTWKNGVGFRYDASSFKKTGEFRIPTPEGWGLTHDSASLLMSDGSNNIYYLDPSTLQVKNMIRVTDHQGPVGNLNELEWVNGTLYANRWQTPYILRIDLASGKVTGRIDLTAISNEINSKYPESDVLNGIAYNAASGTFFVTGKKWPFIYELRLQ